MAAPVLVGIIEREAARARRGSVCGRSRIFWSFVKAWVVVIKPCFTPNLSWRTLTTGARQLVVHEALLIIRCFAGL